MFLLIILGGISLNSCTVYQASLDSPEISNLPERYSSKGLSEALPERWWLEFSDENLNELVVLSLSDNLDLKQAWARLEQSRALAEKSGASRMFNLSLDPQV